MIETCFKSPQKLTIRLSRKTQSPQAKKIMIVIKIFQSVYYVRIHLSPMRNIQNMPMHVKMKFKLLILRYEEWK